MEKIAVKHKEKEKILDDIVENKKGLKNLLEVANSSLDNKEGFINIKEKDSGYFKKRYFKILNGNLVYYKIKKGTVDVVDFTKMRTISNLLLTNVKKNDKEYDYPFCFEVISAANKKSFVFQANNEREASEWFFVIRNAISSSISGYNNQPDTGGRKSSVDSHSQGSIYESHDFKNKMNNELMIDKIINSNKCADCSADKPVW